MQLPACRTHMIALVVIHMATPRGRRCHLLLQSREQVQRDSEGHSWTMTWLGLHSFH